MEKDRWCWESLLVLGVVALSRIVRSRLWMGSPGFRNSSFAGCWRTGTKIENIRRETRELRLLLPSKQQAKWPGTDWDASWIAHHAPVTVTTACVKWNTRLHSELFNPLVMGFKYLTSLGGENPKSCEKFEPKVASRCKLRKTNSSRKGSKKCFKTQFHFAKGGKVHIEIVLV